MNEHVEGKSSTKELKAAKAVDQAEEGEEEEGDPAGEERRKTEEF